jgi:hypothetical protein
VIFATPFVTYLWHYLIARLLYDELIRPLLGGRVLALLPLAAIVAFSVLAYRAIGRSRSRRPR